MGFIDSYLVPVSCVPPFVYGFAVYWLLHVVIMLE